MSSAPPLRFEMTQTTVLKETVTNAARFAVGIVIVVVGALMVAEGVLGWVSDTSMFFPGINDSFVFWVGVLSIMIGGTFMSFYPRRR